MRSTAQAVISRPLRSHPSVPRLTRVAFADLSVAIGVQVFTLRLDTGSSMLVVAGAGCSACSALNISPLFNESSGTDTGTAVTGSYGDGANGWSGEAVAVNVSVAGTPSVVVIVAALLNQTGGSPLTPTAYCPTIGPSAVRPPFVTLFLSLFLLFFAARLTRRNSRGSSASARPPTS